MEEQESHDVTQQNSSSEDNQNEASGLLERQKHEILKLFVPANLLGVVGAYLLFVYTLITLGGLAASTGHTLTAHIIFYSSIPLIILPIAALLWYLRPIPKEEKIKEVRRVNESRLARFVNRHIRIFQLFSFLMLIANIIFEISHFERHPRYALSWIAVSLVGLFVLGLLIVFEIMISYIDRTVTTIGYLLDTLIKHGILPNPNDKTSDSDDRNTC